MLYLNVLLLLRPFQSPSASFGLALNPRLVSCGIIIVLVSVWVLDKKKKVSFLKVDGQPSFSSVPAFSSMAL